MNSNNPYFSSARPGQYNNANYPPQPYYIDSRQSAPVNPNGVYVNVLNQNSVPHYPQHSYPVPELNFAPPVHEVMGHSNSGQPHYVQPSYPINQTGHFNNAAPFIDRYSLPGPHTNVSAPHGNQFGFSGNTGNNYGGSYPQKIEQNAPIFVARQRKHDYFGKKIENDLIKRTACIGDLNAGAEEFDDYFETHIEKFFTPELHQFMFYHDTRHIYGIQLEYRDPWGKMDKETYKGNLHMSKKVSPKSCTFSTFKLDFDEYLTEMYVDGKDEITYFKLVTNEERVFEIGQAQQNKILKNLVVPLTRIMGIGGTFDLYLNGVYFYYN